MTTELEENEFAFEELRALYDLAHALHGATGHDQIVKAFFKKLNDVVPYDCAAIILPTAGSGNYEITHASGEYAASLVGRKVVPGEGVSGWVIANRHPFCNADPRIDLPPAIADKFNYYRTLAVFPVLKGDDLFGAVTLYSSSLDKYNATHQRLLAEASGLLALALSAITDVIPQLSLQQTRVEGNPLSLLASHKNALPSPNSAHVSEHNH